MKPIIDWLVTSSADPRVTSLTVKSLLIGAIPTVLYVLDFTCGLKLVCTDVTGDELATISETTSNLVFLVFSAISVAGTLFGLVRKLLYGRWSAPRYE
jgi:hypothetical protein